MKYPLLLFSLLISSLCFSQTLVDVNKIYHREDILLTDGLVYKWDVINGNDTARYFNPGNDVYEATVVFRKKGAIVNPVLKETINDTGSTRVSYIGTWLKFGSQSWTNGSCAGCTAFRNNDVSITSVIGSSASLTFTGKKIVVVAEFRENHGVANIEVKQGTTIVDSKTVDMYSNTKVNAPAEIFSSIVLPLGTYTVTVSLNSVTTGRDSMVLDSFLIYE